ncbi:MAG: STAS domain-containing protein [Pseudomonadota bacterium]
MLLLPATVTQKEAAGVLRVFREAVQRLPAADELVVDASALQRFDSAALALILECQRMARRRGSAFVLRDAPPRLLELARLYGVSALFASVVPAGQPGLAAAGPLTTPAAS